MKTLCDITAFRFHRIPPQIHALLDDELDRALGPGQWSLCRAAELLGLPKLPLHVLHTSHASYTKTVHQRPHLLSCELPFGSLHVVGPYLAVTSPALTLFTMAGRLNQIDLIMLMHEACGTFSVYEPTRGEREYLQDRIDRNALERIGGWVPVIDRYGKLTDLWRRPPLVTLNELQALSVRLRGVKGSKTFAGALRYVHEHAASPFEVQAGMRFSLPPKLGGEGMDALTFNYRVDLSAEARLISNQRVAFIDVLLRSSDGMREVGIECQSVLMHDSAERGVADGSRITALQSMGYTMVQLAYDNLMDPDRFASIVAYLKRSLEIASVPKTSEMRRAEIDLCARLFVSWASLGL